MSDPIVEPENSFGYSSAYRCDVHFGNSEKTHTKLERVTRVCEEADGPNCNPMDGDKFFFPVAASGQGTPGNYKHLMFETKPELVQPGEVVNLIVTFRHDFGEHPYEESRSQFLDVPVEIWGAEG